MKIDHIGIVVKSIDKGIKQWEENFGYSRITDIVENTRQKVKVVFLEKSDSIRIKLIEPTDPASGAFTLYKKGGGLHHLCFKCDNLDQKIKELKENGLRTLAAPEPGEAFENEKIAFLYAKQGLNIELIDTDKLAARIGIPENP